MKNFIQSRNFWENSKLHLTLFLFFLALLSLNTVANAQVGCTLTAENSVNVYVDENCEGNLDYTALLTDDGAACSNNAYDYIVFLYDENYVEIDHGTGSVVIPSGNVGNTLYGKVEYNPIGNQTGFIPLHIFDNINPTIDCPTDTMEVACWQSDSTILKPLDNCSDAHLVWTDESVTSNDCSSGPGGLNWPFRRFKQISRTYVAVDASGNLSDPCEVVLNINSYDYWNAFGYPNDSLSARIWGVPNLQKSLGNAISCQDADNYKDADGNFDPNKTGWPDLIYWDENPTTAELAAGDRFDTVAIDNSCKFNCNLAATYIDVKVNTCPDCIEKVVRTWSVVETNCDPNNYNSLVHVDVQFIEVVDTVPPVIVCPDNQTVNTNQFNCLDTYTFPVPGVTDNCQTEWEWDILIENNSNFPQVFIDNAVAGVTNVHDLPVDTNHITYTITEACGNKSQCTFDVIVEDKVEPVAVCQTFTTVSLTYDGEAQLPAFAVNSGSYDNCSVVSLQIKRMETNDAFADYVTYDCSDLAGQPWMVVLEVTDAAGNKGQCMVSVEVQDKLPPTITCPDDMEVECDFIYEPDSLKKYFGWPTAHDNCNVVITTDSKTDENPCYSNPVKIITRHFTATDDGGRTDNCTQTINFVHTNYFGYDGTVTDDDALGAIHWPEDKHIDGCINPNDAANSDSPLNPAQSGWPVLEEYSCDQVGYQKSDFVVVDNDNDYDNNEACFKIIRTWTVIDDCHKINGSFVKWQHDQVIYVTNDVDPVIDETPDKMVCTYDSTCVGGYIELKYGFSDDCTQAEDLRWKYYIDLNNDSGNDVTTWEIESPIHSGDTIDASGTYNIGTHKIMYQVWDQCGNSAVSVQLFTIQNCKKPTPICIDGLTVNLSKMNNETVAMIRDTMFDGGSYHTCGYDLVFSFSSDTSDHTKTYTCDDLGLQPVELWVTALLPDGSTTQDYCTTSIEVQDNDTLCTNPLPHGIVSGAIVNEDNEPVENVEVSLVGSELGLQKTNNEGKYEFPPVIYGKNYTVVPQSGNDYMNGLSTLDLVYIQKHILGIKELSSPYAMIASDVNNDQKISASDILTLRKLILGVNEVLDNNNAWKFISSSYNFENPENPIAEKYPQNFKISDLESDMSANFIAVKIGDASGDATVNNNGDVETRNSESLSLVIDDNKVQRNQTVEIPVFAKDFSGIQGFQATFTFDPNSVSFENIESGALNLDMNNIATNRLSNGYLPMSWFNPTAVDIDDDAVLFTLVFESNANGNIRNILSVNSDITKKEAYNSSLEKMDINIEYRNTDSSFELMQNRPNPFANSTEIIFNMPENSDYELNVYDITGKLVFKTSGSAEKGLNSIDINKTEINTTGVLYYTLKAGKYSATKKMVVIK